MSKTIKNYLVCILGGMMLYFGGVFFEELKWFVFPILLIGWVILLHQSHQN